MKIELLFFRGCPNAEAARALLYKCIAAVGACCPVEEREGDYASPSILIDGEDVMGLPLTRVRCCRLDVPTEARLMERLRTQAHGGS